MLFHTLAFFFFLSSLVFLTLIVSRFWLFPFLIIASYAFYGWGAGYFTILLALTSLLDFGIALFFNRSSSQRRYGIWLSAIMNFGVLAYFKYANFAMTNFISLLTSIGVESQFSLKEVILPLGISFYTFQSFAYVVDVLTGKIQPCRSLGKYLLFSSWFPQLIAGPISRAEALMPQLEKLNTLRETMRERLPQATALFAEGWCRKMFADLAALTANALFTHDPAAASGSLACYGVIAFGIQIYGDFSGYSRMAQGVSWLFGVKLIDNFNVPYGATSIREFWHRWHISLSQWFRDYVYIPLGGNRHGKVRTYLNLAFTMMLCGLWHGANWTFIVWGGMHGSMLILERIGSRFKIALPNAMAFLLTLLFVFLAWVPFRAANIHSALDFYRALFHPGWSFPTQSLIVAILGIVLCDLTVLLGRTEWSVKRFQQLRAATWTASGVVVWQLALILGLGESSTFIYFQF